MQPDVNLLNQSPTTFQGTTRTDATYVRTLLTSDDTFATTLLVWFMDTYPEQDEEGHLACLKWSPETIKMELDRAAGTPIPKVVFDKLMAAITIVTTDMFFKNVKTFIPIANILAGDDFQPDELEPPDAAECAWAITEALLLYPPDEEDPELFCDEIRTLIGFTLKEEGFVTPPDVLRIALGGDFTAQVSSDFADDPEMFSGIYAVQQGKKTDVELILREGLSELIQQLTALPLRHGSTADLVNKVRSSIN